MLPEGPYSCCWHAQSLYVHFNVNAYMTNNDLICTSSYEIINIEAHNEGHKDESYFLMSRYLADYDKLSQGILKRFDSTKMHQNNRNLDLNSILDQLNDQ